MKFIVTTASGGTDVIIDKLSVQPCCVLAPPAAMQPVLAPREGPNPTAGSFTLATPLIPRAVAELAVYDLSGRRVAALRGPAGSVLVWDGRGRDGRRVPNGVYLYRLQVASQEQRGRVVVLR